MSAAEVANAFSGCITVPKVPFAYGLGLFVNAIFVLLLPIGYLALVGAVLIGVLYYAVWSWPSLFSRSGPGIIIGAVLYVGPIIGGLTAVFFLFKPLLARPCRISAGKHLSESENPRLFQLVHSISDMLGARRPAAIYLSPHVSASASVETLGRRRELHLGLALVGGLTVEELAAVVAHEVAHGNQSVVMRLYNLVERTNRWFLRVVYERDTWDKSLDEWVNSLEGSLLYFVGLCCNFGVIVSRLVLTGFMILGRAGTCYLCRQMEYHADACSSVIAGSATVEATLLRSRELAIVERIGHQALSEIWTNHKHVPDSLPEFLSRLDGRISPETREQIAHTIINERSGLFRTHPTDAQRIQQARLRADPAIFHMKAPAKTLFGSFEPICADVTLRYYNDVLKLRVGRMMLKPAAYFFGKQDTTTHRFVVPSR